MLQQPKTKFVRNQSIIYRELQEYQLQNLNIQNWSIKKTQGCKQRICIKPQTAQKLNTDKLIQLYSHTKRGIKYSRQAKQRKITNFLKLPSFTQANKIYNFNTLTNDNEQSNIVNDIETLSNDKYQLKNTQLQYYNYPHKSQQIAQAIKLLKEDRAFKNNNRQKILKMKQKLRKRNRNFVEQVKSSTSNSFHSIGSTNQCHNYRTIKILNPKIEKSIEQNNNPEQLKFKSTNSKLLSIRTQQYHRRNKYSTVFAQGSTKRKFSYDNNR